MKRHHLFEIHDYSWCPTVLRDGLTDFLRYNIQSNDLYGPIKSLLMEAVRDSRSTRIIDLCSGAGGPWQVWTQEGLVPCPVILTDKYPNARASERYDPSRLAYFPDSVDATGVPSELTGFRTIFTAFHHFTPEQGRHILADAIAKRQPIGIFEFTFRSPSALLLMLASSAAVWAFTPKLPRVTRRKLLLTYLVPAIPAIVTFDGIVSCLRTYKPDELRDLAGESDNVVVQGTARGGKWPLPITYFVAYPKARVGSASIPN